MLVEPETLMVPPAVAVGEDVHAVTTAFAAVGKKASIKAAPRTDKSARRAVFT
jgi:hypothetical protein